MSSLIRVSGMIEVTMSNAATNLELDECSAATRGRSLWDDAWDRLLAN